MPKRDKLISLRLSKKITQKQIAESLNINRSHYGFIESGTRNPSYDVAKRIAEFFELDIRDIFPDLIFFSSRSYDMNHYIHDK